MAITLEIKVIPKAREAKIIQDKSGRTVIYVKSPPEDGKANREIIKLLSHILGISQANIDIVLGLTSKNKKIKISGSLTQEELFHKLGFSMQGNFLK